MRLRVLAVVSVLFLFAACGEEPDGSSPPPPEAGEVSAIPYRLLGDDLAVGDPWSTRVIESSDELAEVVDGSEMDWETEVVFMFTLAESSSCPFGPLEGLEFSPSDARLYPAVDLEGSPTACTDDANPHTIVVAVDQSELPHGEFSLWVENNDPPQGVADGVTRVGAGEFTDSPNEES